MLRCTYVIHDVPSARRDIAPLVRRVSRLSKFEISKCGECECKASVYTNMWVRLGYSKAAEKPKENEIETDSARGWKPHLQESSPSRVISEIDDQLG